MNMTHYMGLLAEHQPWNLLFFMAIPVILAETIAITELAILFNRGCAQWIKKLNRISGIVVGLYFLGVFLYLMKTAVIPITLQGEWRGVADVVAVGSYLLGVVPLFGITMLELGWIGKLRTPEEKLKLHATFVGIFLIVAHVAMIFGMLNPSILGYHVEPKNTPGMTM